MPPEAPLTPAPERRTAGVLWHLPQALLIGLVRGYRLLLKPWLGNACRFEPSCSAYTLQALQQHGALGGSALGGARLLRCHPWCEGGLDPVPEDLRAGLTGHLPGRGLFTRWLAPGNAGRPVPSLVPGTVADPDTPARSELP